MRPQRPPSHRAPRPGSRIGACRLAAPVLAAVLIAVACGGASRPQPSPQASPLPGRTVDLASEPADLTLWAADAGDLKSDLPSLAAGDVNGDGLPDLIVGARFGDGPDNARLDAGEVYVVFGAPEMPATIDIAASDQDLTLWGASPGDNLGYFVRAADVNGDGMDDILAGAPFASRSDAPGHNIGAVLVFFGARDLGGELDAASADQDVTLWGPSPSSFFGDSIASGDVNADGINDIIAGSTFSLGPDGQQQVGAAYVFFGSRDLSGTEDVAAGDYDFVLAGAEDLDEVGDAVASGDYNGDGVDDIVVVGEAADGPQNGRSTAGEAYVVYGSADLGGGAAIGEDAPDVTLFGAETNDIFGFSIACGDVDGDGIDDILVGARGGDGPEGAPEDAGRVYIFLGSRDPASVIDTAKREESASISGADGADLFDVVSLAGVSADGTRAIAASAAYGDGPGNGRRDSGEAFIIIGSALRGVRSVLDAPRLLSVYGTAAEERIGAAVLAADLNGDGKEDLVALSADGDGPRGTRPDAGEVYVILGR